MIRPFAIILCLLCGGLVWAAPVPFTVGAETTIVLPEAPDRGRHVQVAADYLREGIAKMTGRALPIVRQADLARGLVLATTRDVPALRDDPAVREALKNTGEDSYNDVEAFFIRSERDRVLVAANTADGLLAGVVELLESVEYEVLGMGPNWIHLPDYANRPLVFNLERAGRPGYYIRRLWATTGQGGGVGTLTQVAHPDDEPVGTSYRRWLVGTRMQGQSMPNFGGHALQGYHKTVAERMLATKSTDGFLVKKCSIGPDPVLENPALDIDPLLGDGVPGALDRLFGTEKPAPKPGSRPPAGPENAGEMWISTDRDPAGVLKVFLSDGQNWVRQDINEFHVKLDVSVPMVREILFAEMKRRAIRHFAENPDDLFIFVAEPEDGGNSRMGDLLRYPNWYPDYLKAEGVPFGQPYVLHGYNGLDHPVETWDPHLQANTVFGFNNWLLREFDKWIDSLPPDERVTATGRSKKELVRCSGLSYAFHDVPPDFNLDHRIRLMIAGFPKHRGRGRWAPFGSSHIDNARAFKVMLPREPSGDYRIVSLAKYRDGGPGGIPARWSASARSISADMTRTWHSGMKAMSMETDFNFGKFGLAYYLVSKMLWNPELTADELDAIRDRWLQRAYGSVWPEMKAYYDFMLTENYPVNSPNAWARAVRLIDAAQQRLDGAKEPAAQRRLDDLKQYWYYHYLGDSGQAGPNDAALLEYIWKGQMSYMVAMHMVLDRHFAAKFVRDVIGTGAAQKGPEIDDVGLAALDRVDLTKGPAHYTHAETQRWWAKVLEHWQPVEMIAFREGRLANGRPARDVDLEDLVRVREFRGGPDEQPYLLNSAGIASTQLVTRAAAEGEEVGFKLFWPFQPNRGAAFNAREVPYGLDRYDPATGTWEMVVDKEQTTVPSVAATGPDGTALQYVEARVPVPAPGLYRFDIGRGGNSATLAGLGYELAAGTYRATVPFTLLDVHAGPAQSPAFFYIPKGTKRLDFEIAARGATLYLYTGLPAAGMPPPRRVECRTVGAHTIELQPGEDGTVAEIRAGTLAVPYFPSIPGGMWAKSPAALLIPRAIAEADGLTIE